MLNHQPSIYFICFIGIKKILYDHILETFKKKLSNSAHLMDTVKDGVYSSIRQNGGWGTEIETDRMFNKDCREICNI